MAKKRNLIEIRPVLRLDLRMARKQRDYCVNEAQNKRGEEAELLDGIVNLYDYLIDKALTVRAGPPF
jgi:hypothetical protein